MKKINEIYHLLIPYILAFGIATSGWIANDATRYVTEVYRKAQVCDQIKCDELQDAAQRIKDSKLPVLK